MHEIDRQFDEIQREVTTIVATHRNGEKLTPGQVFKASDWPALSLLATTEEMTLEPQLKHEGRILANTAGKRFAHILKRLTGGYGADARHVARAKAIKAYKENAAVSDQLDTTLASTKALEAKMKAEFDAANKRFRQADEARAVVVTALANDATTLQGKMTVNRPIQLKTGG